MSVLRGLDEGFEGGDEVEGKESGALLLLLFGCERGWCLGEEWIP